jgi:hypothetical protein
LNLDSRKSETIRSGLPTAVRDRIAERWYSVSLVLWLLVGILAVTLLTAVVMAVVVLVNFVKMRQSNKQPTI